jgi:hypothetical protein
VYIDWPMCSPNPHYRPTVCGRRKQSLKQNRYSLLLNVKVNQMPIMWQMEVLNPNC